jgi:hypothetical protein
VSGTLRRFDDVVALLSASFGPDPVVDSDVYWGLLVEPLLSPWEGRILRNAGEDIAISLLPSSRNCVSKPSTSNESA